MDAKIADNTLVRMAGGTVLLDANRVWRPRGTVPGARQMNLFSRRIELQSFGKSSTPIHRTLLQNSEPEYGSPDDAGSNQGPQVSTRRRSGQQPVYVMSER